MKYTILQGDSQSDLMLQVNYAITNGWNPQGSVAVSNTQYGYTFYQAMIKEK